MHWVESVGIRSFSDLFFHAFELNKEIYFVNLNIFQCELRKIRTTKTLNMDTFYAVLKTASDRYNIIIIFHNLNLIQGTGEV